MPRLDTTCEHRRPARLLSGLLVLLATVDLAAGAALAFFQIPPMAPEGRFGDCTDPPAGPDIRAAKKCNFLVGNCFGERYELGKCESFPDDAVFCPGPPPVRVRSAKPIEFKAHGECVDSTNKMSTCRACHVYYCVKAQFWVAVGCPDVAPQCTLAVGQTVPGQCDPT